jgi:putative tricarboxylic transport membrane protein
MQAPAARRVDRAGLMIGAALLLVAGLIVYDASRLQITSTYGLGPCAVPTVVAGGLALLAIGNVVSAFTGGLPPRDEADPFAIWLILAGLAAMIAITGVGGGFILAMAVLFATTATAMGRRKPAADLAIGLALGLLVYLMFAKLLSLSLPAGPLESLI